MWVIIEKWQPLDFSMCSKRPGIQSWSLFELFLDYYTRCIFLKNAILRPLWNWARHLMVFTDFLLGNWKVVNKECGSWDCTLGMTSEHPASLFSFVPIPFAKLDVDWKGMQMPENWGSHNTYGIQDDSGWWEHTAKPKATAFDVIKFKFSCLGSKTKKNGMGDLSGCC